MAKLKRFILGLSDRQGVAAVEFALIAPVLLIMLLGLIDVAFMIIEKSRLNQVTREVATSVMFGSTDAALNAIIDEQISLLGGPINGGILTRSVAIDFICGGTVIGSPYTLCPDGTPPQKFVTVDISKPHSNNLLPDKTLRSTVVVELR